MKEYRCEKCHKLLFKGQFNGIVEILCTRCKEVNRIIECQHRTPVD